MRCWLTRFLLIDASNIFYRSYFGLRYTALKNEQDEATFAVHGSVNAVASVVKRFEPSFVLAAFDWGRSAHRTALYPDYKGGRGEPPPNDAIQQLRTTRKLLTLFGMFEWREQDTEADDIIATCVTRWKGELEEIIIVSGDKDLMQLIDDNVVLVKPALGGKTAKPEEIWDADMVREKYGVWPHRLPEVWALSGDAGDGVPGLSGVGEKTAIKLIEKYGSASAVALSREKKVLGHEKNIALSLKLVALDGSHARCSFSLDELRWDPTRPGDSLSKSLTEYLESLELRVLEQRWRDGSLWRQGHIGKKRLQPQQISRTSQIT